MMNPGEDRKLDQILKNQGNQQRQLNDQDRQLNELRRAVNGDPEGTGDEGMRVKVNRMDVTFKAGRLVVAGLAFLVAVLIPLGVYLFSFLARGGG